MKKLMVTMALCGLLIGGTAVSANSFFEPICYEDPVMTDQRLHDICDIAAPMLSTELQCVITKQQLINGYSTGATVITYRGELSGGGTEWDVRYGGGFAVLGLEEDM